MNSFSAVILTLSSLGGAPQDELLDFTATWCGPCQTVAPAVERLRRKGYPIRKVDVDKYPELAKKYGVESIPQFILIVDGKPVKRLLGPQSETTLARLMAEIPRKDSSRETPKAKETAIARDDRPSKRRGIPIPFLGKNKEITADEIEMVRGQNEEASAPTKPEVTPEAAVKQPVVNNERGPFTSNPMVAAVRLRVNQNGSINFGTGTIIESRPSHTLIISCGHIFRRSNKETSIEVDYFEGDKPITWKGQLVRYDDKADVGLIVVKPNRVLPAIKVASDTRQIAARNLVFSVGCGNGEPPTRWQMFVKSVDQFVGSSIIECTQAPVSGRSGGGLFNRRGELIGICMAADRDQNSGLYAGLKEVHKLLDAVSLTALYQTETPTAAIAKTEEAHTIGQPKPMPPAAEIQESVATSKAEPPAKIQPHLLTTAEIDAIAAAMQLSGPSGVTVRIESDSSQSQKYQIFISNRAELPDRPVTVVSTQQTSPQTAEKTGTAIVAQDLQPGQVLKWDNLLDRNTSKKLQPVATNASEGPIWAK